MNIEQIQRVKCLWLANRQDFLGEIPCHDTNLSNNSMAGQKRQDIISVRHNTRIAKQKLR
jgi:hypothetical protein